MSMDQRETCVVSQPAPPVATRAMNPTITPMRAKNSAATGALP